MQKFIHSSKNGGYAYCYLAPAVEAHIAEADARIAELEKALRHVLAASDGQCENYTGGIGSCLRNHRAPDAQYGADRCCWSCLAHSVL